MNTTVSQLRLYPGVTRREYATVGCCRGGLFLESLRRPLACFHGNLIKVTLDGAKSATFCPDALCSTDKFVKIIRNFVLKCKLLQFIDVQVLWLNPTKFWSKQQF